MHEKKLKLQDVSKRQQESFLTIRDEFFYRLPPEDMTAMTCNASGV